MTPNWVIVKLHLPRLSRDGISPLCGGTGKRKSDSVKFAILALTAKLTHNECQDNNVITNKLWWLTIACRLGLGPIRPTECQAWEIDAVALPYTLNLTKQDEI
jgi:hypothetical protein